MYPFLCAPSQRLDRMFRIVCGCIMPWSFRYSGRAAKYNLADAFKFGKKNIWTLRWNEFRLEWRNNVPLFFSLARLNIFYINNFAFIIFREIARKSDDLLSSIFGLICFVDEHEVCALGIWSWYKLIESLRIIRLRCKFYSSLLIDLSFPLFSPAQRFLIAGRQILRWLMMIILDVR